jgi:CRISPR-associated protein Cas2
MKEVTTLVVYDIEEDRVRNKIADICLDYGLERFQYSAFMGRLTRNMREQLFLKLSSILARRVGKILVLPVCEKDLKGILRQENRLREEGRGNAT